MEQFLYCINLIRVRYHRIKKSTKNILDMTILSPLLFFKKNNKRNKLSFQLISANHWRPKIQINKHKYQRPWLWIWYIHREPIINLQSHSKKAWQDLQNTNYSLFNFWLHQMTFIIKNCRNYKYLSFKVWIYNMTIQYNHSCIIKIVLKISENLI